MKNTKRALIMSALSLLLCVSMLVGTTFAWFTDSVTSGKNTIQSGNLDVELEYYNGTDWEAVDANTTVFGYDNWEPGFTKVVKFRVTNKGSLALKYTLTADVYSETPGTNKAGDSFLLSDYLYTATVAANTTRDEILATTGVKMNSSLAMVADKELLANAAPEEVALAIWMPTTVGNEANHNGNKQPTIDFGVNLLATQYTYEEDSFNNQYDQDAKHPDLVGTAADLKDALANDEDVLFADDVTFTGSSQTPDRNNYVEVYGNKVGFAQYGGVIDGNGKELIDNEGDKSYVIVTHGGTIKNLTITTGARGIVTYAPTEDVYIDNVVVDGSGYALNSTEYGAVDMFVTNSTINGWTSLAGFASVNLTNCKFGENTKKYWQSMGYDQDYDRLFRVYVATTFTNCEFEQGYYLDLSAGGTATLNGCTVNGTKITAENYANYITIELPTGTTLADVVTFG